MTGLLMDYQHKKVKSIKDLRERVKAGELFEVNNPDPWHEVNLVTDSDRICIVIDPPTRKKLVNVEVRDGFIKKVLKS